MESGSSMGINKAAEQEESEDILDQQELTDTDLSQKFFYEGIKKLVTKSMKRKEIRNTIRNFKRKKSKLLLGAAKPNYDDGVPKAYSRCSISLFSEVIKNVLTCPHKIQLVKEMGFEFMLQLDDCSIPRAFVQWLADNASTDGDAVVLHGVSIKLTPKAVQDTFSLPAGQDPVQGDSEFGKISFLALFGLSEVPTTRFFADKIVKEELTDDMFKRCFMIVCNATFLCPTSSTKPSTRYMGALVDTDKIQDFNWPKFVNDWLQMYIKKYLKEKLKENRMSMTLGGCIYHLAVRCLDFMDFGLIQLPDVFPRICLWKGDLIKHFSDMDIDKNGKYGARPIKEMCHTCYGKTNEAKGTEFAKFRSKFDTEVGVTITDKVKDDVWTSFERNMANVDEATCMKALTVVLEVLKICATSKTLSGDTQVIESYNSKGSHNRVLSPAINDEATSHNQTDIQDQQADLNHRKRKRNETKSNASEKTHCSENDNLGNNSKRKMGISTDLNEDVLQEQSDGVINNGLATADINPPEDIMNKKDYLDGRSCSFNNMNKSHATHFPPGSKVSEPTVEDTATFQGFQNENMQKDAAYDDESRVEYLKEARKKYYFKDASLPSHRLFEWQDDNGKVIEEKELWRPLNTYSQEDYNEEEKQNETIGNQQHHHQDADTRVFETPKNQAIDCDSDYETIVQCAQPLPKSNCIDLTLDFMDVKGICKEQEINEDPHMDVKSDFLQSQTAFEKSGIVGRKLFQQEEASQQYCSQRLPREKQSMSPEVEFVGEKNFNHEQKVLATKADDYYNTKLSLDNTKLSLGNTSSLSGKENVVPRRWTNPSKYVSSPYDVNDRSVITDYEEKLYEAITTLCDITEFRDEKAINIDNCTVSMEQIGNSMKPDGWVEAYVINAFCRKLFREFHPSKSKKHYFFHTCSEYFLEKWKNENARLRWKENVIKSFQGAGSARKLHLSERLYFPSVYNDHWFVFAVDITAKKFIFLDSVYGQNHPYHTTTISKLRTNFITTWYDANQTFIDFEAYQVVFPKMPKQTTGNDCGIFAMKIMELWCPRNAAQYAFSQNDIPYFRKRLAIDNVFNQFNKEDTARALIRNFILKTHKNKKGA